MEIKPLMNYNSPKYPKLEVFANEPDKLLENVPQSWKMNKVVWAALISFALGNQNCTQVNSQSVLKTEIVSNEKQDLEEQNKVLADSVTVAPLFIHGEGIGVFGCIVMMPPVFINEEDARKIILEELKMRNLNFEDTYDKNIRVERTTIKYSKSDGNLTTEEVVEEEQLRVDGFHKELNFAFEFVGPDDYDKYSNKEPYYSSVSEEDYKEAAENVRKAIKKDGNVNAVVFYEPLSYLSREERESYDWKDSDKWEKKRQLKAEEMLRKQVGDFIDWLKKEKFIKE